MQAVLKEDIKTGHKDVFYGRKNQKVTIVTKEHAPVLIVRDEKGRAFPVHTDKVNQL